MIDCKRCGALRSEDAMTELGGQPYCSDDCVHIVRMEDAYDVCYVCAKPIDTVNDAEIGHESTEGAPVMVHSGECYRILEGDSTGR